MAKFKLIYYRPIINYPAQEFHSIEGLTALDSYHEAIIDTDDKADEKSLIEQYEEVHPELAGWDLRIERLID